MADNFKIIGFTSPSEWTSAEAEADSIIQFLDSEAIDFFHIRKKQSSESYTRSLLSMIPERLHSSLVLHSHYDLLKFFHLKGSHGIISKSCHSLQELKEGRGVEYSFLSPIFDSISKKGYESRFSLQDENLINSIAGLPVIALGGVTPDDFQKLFQIKFAGAALLGYLWSPNSTLCEKISHIKEARNNLHSDF